MSERKALIVFKKLKAKAKLYNKRTPVTTDISVEPVGNQEFVDIAKKDYGFDWYTRKFLSSEDYQPE